MHKFVATVLACLSVLLTLVFVSQMWAHLSYGATTDNKLLTELFEKMGEFDLAWKTGTEKERNNLLRVGPIICPLVDEQKFRAFLNNHSTSKYVSGPILVNSSSGDINNVWRITYHAAFLEVHSLRISFDSNGGCLARFIERI